ncbi:MAG: hypothetical protein ABL907_11605, partial [Hyphomicrobium sp.]
MQELWIGYYSGAIAALIITTVTHYFAPDFFPFAVAGFVLITPAAIAIYRYGDFENDRRKRRYVSRS